MFSSTGAVVSSGSNMLGSALTPSSFWSFVFGILKSVGSRLLSYWFVFAIIIVSYIFIVFFYHFLWSYVVSYFQKKGYKKDSLRFKKLDNVD